MRVLTRTLHTAARSYSHPSLLPTVLSASNLSITSSLPSRESSHRVFDVGTRTPNGLEDVERVVPFYISCSESKSRAGRPIGYLRSGVVQALRTAHATAGSASPWSFRNTPDAEGDETLAVAFSDVSGGKEAQTATLKELLYNWKKSGLFPDILKGWNDEQFPVFAPGGAPEASNALFDNAAFAIERAALPLFGFPNYGSFLIAWFTDNGAKKFWIPQRSKTKKTWPGALDVTVGGGIAIGSSPYETVVRECAEEASIPSSFARQHARFTGHLPFPNRSPSGWLLPGRYYLFDMNIPSDAPVKPRPNIKDGEVENFRVMGVEEVLVELSEGHFKPSSALAMAKFLIAHGHVTSESEPGFDLICAVLRGDNM